MKFRTFLNSVMMAVAVIGLAACGGGSGGGATAGSGSSVAGAIAGFGSVIMSNGVEYNTDNVTACEVDNQSVSGKCEDSLSVGMIVSMQVDATGAVTSIRYDDDLQGPATNVSGSDGNFSFQVFGADITTTSPGTQWRNFTTNPPLLTELDGANVEISGEWQGTMLAALYVEKQSDTTHEAEGTVGTVTGMMFALTLRDGTVIDVDATGANFMPQAGDYVGVEGNFDGTIFVATKVDIKDKDDFDSDGEAEITGTLTQDANSSTGHVIGATDVDISNAPNCDSLIGSVVEAKGSYDQASGVLVVDTCKNEGEDLEMKCLAGMVTANDMMPKVGSIACTYPGATGEVQIEFRDAPDLAVFSGDSTLNPFALGDVRAGDCIEIEARTDASGAHVAGLLKLEDAAMGCNMYKLQGPVDAFTDNVSITVLGVTFVVDAMTAYPNGLPMAGDSVKIIDADGNGTADSVKID